MLNRKYPLFRELKKKERMTVGVFWSECGMQAIGYLCGVVVMTIILSAILPLEEAELTRVSEYVALGMIIPWCIPIAINTRRRLRDAGFTAKAYLWLLLPVIGWLIFVGLLCKKGLPRKPDETLFM